MGFLKRLLGISSEPQQPPRADDTAAENAAVADDPVRFAEWVCRYCLGDGPTDDLPPDDQCERLHITPEERAAYGRELVLMHALGACMFVGSNLSPAYYSAFKRELCAGTAQRIYGIPTDSRIQELAGTLDRYVEHLAEDSHIDFSWTFVERVFPGNPLRDDMAMVGIPVSALTLARSVLVAVRESYCQFKFGVSFEAIQALGRLGKQEQ